MLIFLGVLISIGIPIILLLSYAKTQRDILKAIDQMNVSSLELSEALDQLEKCYKQINENIDKIEKK